MMKFLITYVSLLMALSIGVGAVWGLSLATEAIVSYVVPQWLGALLGASFLISVLAIIPAIVISKGL